MCLNFSPPPQVPETEDPDHHTTKWRPEYAGYMIEGDNGSTTCCQECSGCGGCIQSANPAA